MTREELKKHCQKQIENCEMWARHNGEEPRGKVYEEHKLILELLEQEPKTDVKLTNSEWIDFLCKQFDISRTSAKTMLHVMMSVKKEDNFKKQFSGRK